MSFVTIVLQERIYQCITAHYIYLKKLKGVVYVHEHETDLK